MQLDETVRERAARYLTELDERAPGLIEGVYLGGSVALGDFRPGRSDLDLVVATARPVGPAELAAFADVHAALPEGPHCDAIYLDWDALRGMPDNRPVVPFVVNGRFTADRPCGDLNPVLWTILARHGITLRGPGIADLHLRPDPERLRDYNRENLADYWSPIPAQIRSAVADNSTNPPADGAGAAPQAEPDLPFGQDIVPWVVLGAARLHYTLATGQIASKSATGGYVAERFPKWRQLARRCVRWRHGEQIAAFTREDALATADLTDSVVAAAASLDVQV